MSNRRRARITTPVNGCPCCASLGLPDRQPAVPAEVIVQCCDGCIAALTLGHQHPHAMPALHWHERPGPDGAFDICASDGVVTQSCVVDDHRAPGLVDQGHTTTHDLLVDGLGALRCSGIWWTHHTGEDALKRVVELYPTDDPDPRVASVREGSLEHLNANGHAVFIVAWCFAAGAPDGQVAYG